MRAKGSVAEILARLEAQEDIGVQEIAEALAQRWPTGVIVLVLEKDIGSQQSAMAFGWRGDYFSGLGMVEKLREVMLRDREAFGSQVTGVKRGVS